MCFGKQPLFSTGPFVSRQVVRACSEHKSATLFRVGSIVCLCYMKMLLSIARNDKSVAGQLQNRDLRVTVGGCLGE